MSTRRLRAGVIGLGWAGQQHMAAYAHDPEVELVALAGLEAAQLAWLGDVYGIAEPKRYADWQDLVADADLDVVSVATPTTLHAPVTIAALDAGLHVLSEKPMAESVGRAAEMVAAAERNNRVLDVCFNHRQRGDVQALKRVVDSGVLGRVYYAKAGWLRRAGIPAIGSWFTRKSVSGGGSMMDIGIHMLDMALHLLGEPTVETVTASTYAEFGPRGRGNAVEAAMIKSGIEAGMFDVDDLATAFLRLGGGGTLLLETSWAQWIPQPERRYLTLYGTEGGAHLEWDGPKDPERRLEVWTEVAGEPATVHPVIGPDGTHQASVDNFLAAVRSGGFDSHTGREGLLRAAVIDACYASAESGRDVPLGATFIT